MGHKILLADDSITIQKVIELTFSDEDFELHTVGNGQKAIDEIRAIQPDIVLCDIIMPEKNGYEVCEFIKSTDELKHIPVLLLTGAFEPFDQERAKAAGCEGFLAKPFEPQTLISKVKELLAGAQGAPAAAPSAPAVAPAPTPPAAMPPEPPAPAPLTPDSATQDANAFAGDGEETLLVPPPVGGQPPVIGGPQVPAASMPPPEPSSGLDEGFAVEAGERELAMDPGDHTMLLGANDAPDVPAPPATPPGAGDDIWSNVSSQSEPPRAPEPDPDEGATIFVAEPLSMPLPGETNLGGPVDNEMSVGNEDPDATWQMPSSTDAPSDAPGSGDLGGFEDFASAPPTEPPPMEPAEPAPPAMEQAPPPMEPAPTPPESVDPFTPEPPELGSTNEVSPVELTPEPIPSVDTQATMDPVKAGSDAFSPLPSTPEPASPQPPPMADVSPETPTEMPAMPTEPETPFTPVEPANEPPTLDPPMAAAPPEPPAPPAPAPEPTPTPTPAPAPEPAPVMQASAEAPAAGGADDDLVERVAQRVVDKLSSKIIQEIAWEVVPDLAEGLIQREIDVLKSKIPKSG